MPEAQQQQAAEFDDVTELFIAQSPIPRVSS
jgi:hypothetical protein